MKYVFKIHNIVNIHIVKDGKNEDVFRDDEKDEKASKTDNIDYYQSITIFNCSFNYTCQYFTTITRNDGE